MRLVTPPPPLPCTSTLKVRKTTVRWGCLAQTSACLREGAMMPGVEITGMIVTSCQTHSVQFIAMFTTTIVSPCRSHNANHISTECCPLVTAQARTITAWAMRQRKMGSHTPPCHRRMVITTLFSVFLTALQRRPVLYHTRWLLTVLWRSQRFGPLDTEVSSHPPPSHSAG